jgi:hypothetical protein
MVPLIFGSNHFLGEKCMSLNWQWQFPQSDAYKTLNYQNIWLQNDEFLDIFTLDPINKLFSIQALTSKTARTD